MSHLPILPFLIPFLTAALLLLLRDGNPTLVRRLSLLSVLLAGLSAALLVREASTGTVMVYALGDWPAPYGILLVVDRLAALMVLLLFLLALPALVMACAGTDSLGRHFHPLFQFQLAGIAGAFLTGDIFNLFVCFEILLIASYALLVHAGGPMRARAGLSYVVLNLVGSALFLVAVAILYGTLGTLAMADMAMVLETVGPTDAPLVRTGLALLIAVFLLKAAMLPMAFWLPHVYAAATPPVAALFAIMTKVGVIAIVRLLVTVIGDAPVGAGLVQPWLPLFALATIALGTIGAFAARRLAGITANMVLVSSGTLLFAAAVGSEAALAALLYYLPHSTLATGGLFLLGGAIARRRGSIGDSLQRGPVIANRTTLSLGFALLAIAISGLPPLSGFVGKLMLMQAGSSGTLAAAWWAALLLSSLGFALVLARVGSILFWEPEGRKDSPVERVRIGWPSAASVGALVLASPLLTIGAQPVAAFAAATASQLGERRPYVVGVMGPEPAVEREQRPTDGPKP